MNPVPQTIDVIARAQGRGPEQIVLTPSGLMCAAIWHHEPVEAELIEPAVNVLGYQISGTHAVERREAGRVTGSGAAPRGLTLIRAGSSTEWSIRGSAGQTPYQFLLGQRLLHAQYLLRERSTLPITAVALACGFRSGAHFSSTFRRATGLSPAGFRNSRVRLFNHEQDINP